MIDQQTVSEWTRWRIAADNPAVDAALRDLYTRLDTAVRARGPTCWASGKCCHFDAYGHRLYVTGLEIAWVLRQVEGASTAALRPLKEESAARTLPVLGTTPSCVFQRENLCTIHAVRPMGCRVFFCQQGTQSWQRELYEHFLGELRALHDAHAIPYEYMEWRAGLSAASLAV